MIRAGNSTIIVSRQTSGTNSVYYVTSDHLGSSAAITDSSGNVLVNESFDAFGRRRGSNWIGNPSAGDWTAIAGTTRRGFTEHTMLDNLNLIHMNGRAYDPMIGRFLSADPFIDGAGNTQGWNRYSYVKSNPLSFIDPSGFEGRFVYPGIPIDGPGFHVCIAVPFFPTCEPRITPEYDNGRAPDSKPTIAQVAPKDSQAAWLAEKANAVRDAMFPNLAILRERGVEGSTSDNLRGAAKALANVAIQASRLTPAGRAFPAPEFHIDDREAAGAAIVEVGATIVTAVATTEAKAATIADNIAARATAGGGRAVTDFVADATVVSHGKVIGRGIVDVRATVEGIQSGRLAARDVFRNAEGLLPSKPAGYYREFVHPTPGVSGAGPQRIVAGQGGELYYTPDHYQTFIPLN
jgi:RHS repeat-associated protein